MKFDATRRTFDPRKNYSRVLMQQGRVQLDADWNEQSAIQLNHVRQLGADLIGPCGGPLPAGFSIPLFKDQANPPNLLPQPIQNDFLLTPGRYYVDGILCSNETTPVMVVGYPDNAVGNAPAKSCRIQVFLWTVDGVSFDVDQYLWLFNADLSIRDPAKNSPVVPALLLITAIDYQNCTITVTVVAGDISPYLQAAGSGTPRSQFVRRAPTYLNQRDYPAPPLGLAAMSFNARASQAAFGQAPPSPPPTCRVYLDVWERQITCAEDTSIREVALNGADTTARAKVIAQVKVMPDLFENCPTSYELAAAFQPANRVHLKARANTKQASTDPCTVSPNALYRGPENQLYRVEIHTGCPDASGSPTFKWSRENGSVVFPIAMIASAQGTTTLTLETLGRDDRFGLAEGDWVEVVDDDYVLLNQASPLLPVQSIDRARLTVVLGGTSEAGKDPSKHPVLRRWDQKEGDPAMAGLTLNPKDNAAYIFPPSGNSNSVSSVQDSGWFELEDGVQIQFWVPPKDPKSLPTAAQFRTGDYWLIPARVATGDVEWPQETMPSSGKGAVTTAPVALPPDGITHHYAPLGQIRVTSDGAVTLLQDCAVTFAPTVATAFLSSGVAGRGPQLLPIFPGVLGFAQAGQSYGLNSPNANLFGETIVEAPTQPRAMEMMARPAKPVQTKRTPAAEVKPTTMRLTPDTQKE